MLLKEGTLIAETWLLFAPLSKFLATRLVVSLACIPAVLPAVPSSFNQVNLYKLTAENRQFITIDLINSRLRSPICGDTSVYLFICGSLDFFLRVDNTKRQRKVCYSASTFHN